MQDTIAWVVVSVLGPLVTLYTVFRWRSAKTARYEAETSQSATESQLKQTQSAHDWIYEQLRSMIEDLKDLNRVVVQKSDDLEHKIDGLHHEHSACREHLARLGAENTAMLSELGALRGRITTIENGNKS